MEPDEEHSDDDAEVLKGEEHILRDLRHKIEVTLSQKKRKLLVKDVSFVFEPSSVYGQRSGLAKGWLVTARCGNNRFHKSRPWRQNVVFGINMLARDGMYKPEKAEPSMSAAFTDVQEMKQAAGGSSFIRTIVQSLTEGMPQEAVVLIDATAYDAWPAMASIEARWTARENGQTWFCASVVLAQPSLAETVAKRIGTAVYEAARAGRLALEGWPAFDVLVSQLQEMGSQADMKADQYKVTSPLPCGSLVLVDSLYAKWLEQPRIAGPLQELITEHNNRFNNENKRLADRSPEKDGEPPVKRLKLSFEDTVTQETVDSLTQPITLQVSSAVKFIMSEADSSMYAISEEAMTLVEKELFSFGSGSFSGGADAKTIM
ncbi:unnamed protein product, partial [Effrenium voratum]